MEADIQEQTLECELLGLRMGLSAILRTVQRGPSFPGCVRTGFFLAVGTNAPPQAREQGAVRGASCLDFFQCPEASSPARH